MPMLDWIGKDKVINHHNDVPYRGLDRQYSYDSNGQTATDNDSSNMIIQGDNLEALKSLLPRYEGKIKCIYIDPPYNTGNENWIYNDNVNSPQIQKWLGKVVGAESNDLTRHDKWLCMMYPRLKLLHKLLADDGYIFVSLDFQNESAYFRCICDEIFGSNNFIGELTWESTTQPINSGTAKFGLQQKVEPIFLYCKNKQKKSTFLLKPIENNLKYPHNGKFGKCRFEIIEKSDAGDYNRPTMKFPILGQFPRKGKRWQIGQETANFLEKNGRLEIVDGIVKRAIYPEDELDKIKYEPFWSHFPANEFGTAQTGKEILNAIMGKSIGFDTVKPPSLIESLLSHFDKNAIILDSFAGSGTTAHAVLNLNKSDGGNRKFILIEMLDYAEDITAERVKRVIKGYGEGKKAVDGTGGNFSFYKLGEQLLIDDELNENLPLDTIRKYIWFTETRTDYLQPDNENPYFLGDLFNTDYYFYYEKDRLTTLNKDFLATFNRANEEYLIYADICTLSDEQLLRYNITFKKIPRDITKF